jgi:ClpP class serine protease
VLHTPGGLGVAAMQISRAVEAYPAKLTVSVYAMSGGTLIALAVDEIILGEFSVLGPIDTQIAGLPAASIVRARDSKSSRRSTYSVRPYTCIPGHSGRGSSPNQDRRTAHAAQRPGHHRETRV